MANKQLRNELNRFSNKTEQPLRLYSGALGIYIGGKQYVDVPNRPGFVYVRLSSNISELIQAHNQVVSPVYDLPVLLTKTKTYYEVFGRDVEQWANYDTSSSSFLPKHGFQHEFDPDNGGGGDLVFVHGEQFYPLMGFPSGTDGAGNILIAPYRYYANNDWHYAGNTGTPDLLQYKPTGSANAVLLLVGLTVNTGNPFVKIGTEFAESITGASALTDYVPTSLTVSNEIPGTIVRLVTGTDVITWANIYDARQYMGILQAGSSTFLSLTDTPSSYSGQANKAVTVKPDESGLEFVATITGSSGGFSDGIQETWYPTVVVSTYTGSSSQILGTYHPYSGTYYQLNFTNQGNGLTQVNSNNIKVGNDQPAFVFATNSDYNIGDWVLRGEYTTIFNLTRPTGTHPMTAYCQLFYQYLSNEQLLATSALGKRWDDDTAIVDEDFGSTYYVFRMKLDASIYTLTSDPIAYTFTSPKRLVVKLFVNASSGGIDGPLEFIPSDGDMFSVNLQRQVLDNHYFPISGTFLQLSDTPDSYSGQGSKYVAVKSDASGLEFVTAPVGGGGGSNILVYDDSVFKVTGTAISFDSNLSVVVTGSVAFVSSSGGTTVNTNGTLAQDEGTPLGTGTTFNFRGNNVVATISGSVVDVFITGSTGGGGALILLEQHTGSNSAFIDFTSWYSALYDEYQIELLNLVPQTNNVALLLQMSTNSGVTFSTGSVYSWASFRTSHDGSASAGNTPSAPVTQIQLDGNGGISNKSNYGISGHITLFNPNNSTFHRIVDARTKYIDIQATAHLINADVMGVYLNTGTVANGLRFRMSTGTMSGRICLYGLTKS